MTQPKMRSVEICSAAAKACRKLGFAKTATGTLSHGANAVSLEIVQME
ncbi:hypothetical protein BrE312_2801 [Brenneria sp. EniD312]|nr:hypothetical protein BrE312_2801 [Brenneria sp. EniD312]